MIPEHSDMPSLNGHTDTVPDIVGRLGSPINFAIFTEGNHFPALLDGGVIEAYRTWAKSHAEYAALSLDNIVVVTLPQPMIVGMLLRRGISFGNLTLDVSRASGFYPDVVMAGIDPLTTLHKASVVQAEARVFARNRGLAMMIAAENPLSLRRLDDLLRSDIRVVMASESEPGARSQYISTLETLLGQRRAYEILARETKAFPGRLGIQHRDVLYALSTGAADVGIIFHHLAKYYAEAYPQVCTTIGVPGAERFSSTIALVPAADPLRAQAARAFQEFFLGTARDVYPRYGFATMSAEEYAQTVKLT